MQHLDPERLAALDHDPPIAAELAHLAACADCRTERDAYVSLSMLSTAAASADEAADTARLTDWSELAGRLRAEGLMRSTDEHSIAADNAPLVVHPLKGVDVSGKHHIPAITGAHVQRTKKSPAWLSIAAALLLMLGGAALGRMSSGASIIAPPVATATAPTSSDAPFSSVQEATRVLTSAQRDYERASLWLASNDTTVRSPDVYRARLAALDQMMAASRAALRDAPQDPVLNHYYLAAYTAREATLQQLVSALPVDKTIEGF